jgi:hypothetical protein
LCANHCRHLDGWTFTTERKAWHHGKQTTKEFDGQNAEGRGCGFLAHDSFDVLHSASRCAWRERHQPAGAPDAQSDNDHGE